jgi:hypothetical protein
MLKRSNLTIKKVGLVTFVQFVCEEVLTYICTCHLLKLDPIVILVLDKAKQVTFYLYLCSGPRESADEDDKGDTGPDCNRQLIL